MTPGPGGRSRAPRVAFLSTDSGMGGAEREVCHLAAEFQRRGWAVTAISMLPMQPPIADLASLGIRTFSLEMRLGVPDPRGLVRLGRILRRVRPDVLHAHMVHANLLARLSRLIAPTPVVISTIHNENEGAQWRYVAYRLTNRLSDVTTAVSRVAEVEATRRGAAPKGVIRLVPNGLATSDFERDEHTRGRMRAALDLDDRFTWLAVGRLAEAKGYGDMIPAFAEALRDHPEARLLIAGVGQLEAEIRAEIRRLGVEDSVRLLGLRSDVPALMQAADGFLMTSRWEGLPMVLLEAGASGLPVVATDVGGSRDAVLDGVSGYVTPLGDPASSAGAIGRVMSLAAADRRAMGEAGREHVRRSFDIRAVGDTWERLYRGAGR
jgi:glycosyltransferase involved in cell wall biosynthesis